MKIIHVVALAFLAFANGTQAQVSDYPTRSIKILVPLAAGSGTDHAARYFGQQLAGLLGQSVVIENRPPLSFFHLQHLTLVKKILNHANATY